MGIESIAAGDVAEEKVSRDIRDYFKASFGKCEGEVRIKRFDFANGDSFPPAEFRLVNQINEKYPLKSENSVDYGSSGFVFDLRRTVRMFPSVLKPTLLEA